MANDCQVLPSALGFAGKTAEKSTREENMHGRIVAASADVVGDASVSRCDCTCSRLSLQPASPPIRMRIGLSISLTGPTSPAGKQVLAGLEIWRERRQRKRRPARAARRVRLLRRPGQPRECARHLRQADERRQGRSADRALQHQRDRRGDAGDHPGQPHHHRHFRSRRQQGVQVSALLLDELARARHRQLFEMRVRSRRRSRSRSRPAWR